MNTTPISEFLGKRGRAAENSSNAVSGPVGVTTPTQTRVASVEETPREDTSGNDGMVRCSTKSISSRTLYVAINNNKATQL